MATTSIEVRFSLPLEQVSSEHLSRAERDAEEAFVFSLLRQGDISGGRAAELLGLNRWEISEKMNALGISPFDDSASASEILAEAGRCRRER
jgi:predicted HTH domain antitoxin